MGKKNFKRKLNPNQEQAELYDKITYVQTKIIRKITKLKKLKNNFALCDHVQKVWSDVQFNENINYYDKYWKEYLMAVSLMKRVKQFENHVETLESSVCQIQKKFIERQDILDLPALAIIKKPFSRQSRAKELEKERLEKNFVAQNPVAQLKKQEEVQPQLINYQQQQPHIFYE